MWPCMPDPSLSEYRAHMTCKMPSTSQNWSLVWGLYPSLMPASDTQHYPVTYVPQCQVWEPADRPSTVFKSTFPSGGYNGIEVLLNSDRKRQPEAKYRVRTEALLLRGGRGWLI